MRPPLTLSVYRNVRFAIHGKAVRKILSSPKLSIYAVLEWIYYFGCQATQSKKGEYRPEPGVFAKRLFQRVIPSQGQHPLLR